MNPLSEGTKLKLNFRRIRKAAAACDGVLPVTVQNIDTGEVILLAYTNKKAFRKAIETRTAVFWSVSRNELWEKGKTSGNVFDLMEVYVNCEQNALMYRVRPRVGGICHTKNKAGKPRNCFYRRLNLNTLKLRNLDP